MATETPKTIAFLGASTGIGLAALTRALAAGHTCIALCRKPSKLSDRFPAAQHPNLHVVEGNAHDVAAVSRCLSVPDHPQQLVDAVVSSIGGAFVFSKMTLDDPQVCEKGAATLIEAIAAVRKQQQENGNVAAASWRPRVVVVSSSGLARTGRDYPLPMIPMYKWMLKVPHADKRAMEKTIVDGAAKGYTYTIVRPSLLVDDAAPTREVRVGIDDDFVVGYTISRDDTGRWMYESLLQDGDKIGRYENRIATVTW
ncbi:NAD(P)-binding protein [Hypoxylon rubiginosum]|uniref:NAD(P)-binding protein n=1 Tax=Hypoxylon rubiginosum TaxID=110542 RepID=A0ACC0CZ20_9PEZI|nr:NAD(P)-binding protein [Hypoxylon rubiginosum]